MFRLCLGLLLCACTSAALGDVITDALNARFPPVNLEEQRVQALATTAQALSKLGTPNVAMVIQLEDLRKSVDTQSLRAEGVTGIALRGEDQIVHAQISFTRAFKESDAGGDATIASAISLLKPTISGIVHMYLTITGAVNNGAQPTLELKLLPGLASLAINEVKVGGANALPLINPLAALIDRYRENLSGELARSSFANVTLPALASQPLNFDQDVKVSGGAGELRPVVAIQPVIIKLKLDGIAWLISKNQITAIAQITAADFSAPQLDKPIDATFPSIQYQISRIVSDEFGIPHAGEATWVGIRKELVATTLNNAVKQANMCATVKGASHQKVSTKVPMPSGQEINCTSDRSCESNRVCSFSVSKDERDCGRCLLSRPVICTPRVCAFGGCVGGDCTGGGCAQHGNDPLCETAKAAQNAIYVTDANLRKADCDRLRATETAGCQAEVAGQRALCETGKATLQQIAKSGNFANIDVDTQLSGDSLKACVSDFSFNSSLSRVALGLTVTGDVNADVKVDFTPLDIVGHLTCAVPWSESRSFTASLRDGRLPFDVALKINSVEDGYQLSFETEPITIKTKISPGPTEWLLTSPRLLLSCQGLNLLAPMAVSLTPFVKELQGDFDYKLDRQNASVRVPLPSPSLGEQKIKVQASQTTHALVLTKK